MALATTVGTISFLVLPPTAGAQSPERAASTTSSFVLYVGYADCPSLTTCDATKPTNPSFPQPWYKAKGYTFIGDISVYNLATDHDPDATAIRVDNTGKASLTIDSLSVATCDGGSFDPWGTAPFAYPYTVKAKSNTVFTSTNGDNFDGSDDCDPDATVTIDVNGVTTSYSDDIANGGRGAVVGGVGRPFDDESTPWTKLAGPKVAITLEPRKLPAATTSAAYDAIVGAQGSNGAPTFKVTSGSLPPGLTLAPDSVYLSAAAITGTPTATGTFKFKIAVTDTASPTDSGSRSYTIKVT